MDVFEAMGSAVSMRWLAADPVPDELVEQVLWAATRGSNPGNSQHWHFVVVRDEETRRDLAQLLTARFGRMRNRPGTAPPPADPTARRMMDGVAYLVEHLADVPVLVFVCASNQYPANSPSEPMMYSAAFSAAQNLLVAARALGLGVTYTTFHLGSEAEVKTRLGIPDDVRICVTMPLGWPLRPFGQLTRKPLEEVVHHDHW